MTYEDLTMHDVGTAIQLNQFYFATKDPKPSTMLFEKIYFKNIKSVSKGGGSHGSGGDTSAAINFDCDTKDSGGHNCDVSLTDVSFTGLGSAGLKHGMKCKGVRGTATGLTGINNCLAK